MELDELRNEIDTIDDEIVRLFVKRTQTAKRIGEEKKKTGKAVFDGDREKRVIARLTGLVPQEMQGQIKNIYETVFAGSRSVQNRLLYADGEIHRTVRGAVRDAFPENVTVACCGTACSGIAAVCRRLFSAPEILFFLSEDCLFSAEAQKKWQYAVLPIETEKSDSVKRMYDRLKRYGCRIVRSIREEHGPGSGTRFVCIAKDVQIFPGADRLSLMLCVPNRTGALVGILSQFASEGGELIRLESRSAPDRDNSSVYYLELEISLCPNAAADLLEEVRARTEQFVFLGYYSEI